MQADNEGLGPRLLVALAPELSGMVLLLTQFVSSLSLSLSPSSTGVCSDDTI